jgi:hypothetical protein
MKGGLAMYRFIRTVRTKTQANVAPALQWAGEVTTYINKTYSLGLKFGSELFGKGRIHWHFDTDSLDKITAVNAKMMQDREYLGLLEKAKALWLEGSNKDTIVLIIG